MWVLKITVPPNLGGTDHELILEKMNALTVAVVDAISATDYYSVPFSIYLYWIFYIRSLFRF